MTPTTIGENEVRDRVVRVLGSIEAAAAEEGGGDLYQECFEVIEALAGPDAAWLGQPDAHTALPWAKKPTFDGDVLLVGPKGQQIARVWADGKPDEAMADADFILQSVNRRSDGLGTVNVDDLAQEIRRVDGSHSLGAGELAEALMPFLSCLTSIGVETEDYVVWSNEHRCWWGSNNCGYTKSLLKAGRYSRQDALDIAKGSRNGWSPEGTPDEIAVALRDAEFCLPGVLS